VSQRLRDLDDERLGGALGAMANLIAWPDGPDVATRVTETIRTRERHPALARPRLSLPSRRRTLVLILVGVLLVAAAALAAKLVIDLGAVTIELIPGRPTALPSAVAGGSTLGHPASLGEAELEAGFPARIPTELGPPDRVWVDRAPHARIALAWSATDALPPIDGLPWGAVLYGFRGDAAQASKLLWSEGTTLSVTKVNGQEAYWIEGEHELDLITGDGTVTRYRVTGNVLVWKTGNVVWRLETELRRSEAVRIAATAG
jgi:hypothetical protein